MNLTQMQELKNTPKDKMRSVIEDFNLDELKTTRKLRRDISRIQSGEKFYPREFLEIIDGLSLEIARDAYRDEDGELMYGNTFVGHLVRRDVFGESIPAYIKAMPGWEKIVNAGLAE